MIDRRLLKLEGMAQVMMALFASSLVQAGLIIGQSVALAFAIANLWNGEPLASQASLVACFAICFALRRTVILVQDSALSSFARKRASELKRRLLEKVFDARSLTAQDVGCASAATSATAGIDEIESYIALIPPKLCGVVAVSLPLLVAVFVLDWVSGVILLIAFPTIILFMIMLGRQARQNAERQYAVYHRLSNHFIDTLRGMPTLRVFGAVKRAGDEVFSTSEKLRKSTVATLRIATLSGAVLDLVATFGVAAVAMMLAFGLLDGTQTLGTALAIIMLTPEYFTPIRGFASDFHASLDGKTALAGVLDILERAPSDQQLGQLADVQATEHSRIAFNGIGYEYADKAPDSSSASAGSSASSPESTSPDDSAPDSSSASAALHGITFTVHGYQRIGIVGPSGSGKSTLADIVSGFKAPSKGAIDVDGAIMDDLQDPSWKRALHYIPQEPYVFHASLLDNIRLYSPDATREEVERAIATVGLDDLVEELEEGLDTVIGDSGRGLSGGQAQRIALARVLVSDNCRVLVFDEPTAHLDIETEYELKQKMLPIMDGKLVFFATHRLHWLNDMDYVIVLEGGTIAEAGTPEELLARHGALSRLAHGWVPAVAGGLPPTATSLNVKLPLTAAPQAQGGNAS